MPDRFRARARGELAREDRAALERELAAEPGLRELAEDFELVAALTPDEGAEQRSRTRFEDLEPRLARGAPWRKIAIAAALLVLAGGLFLATRTCARADEPLQLVAIPLEASAPASALPADLPASWNGFEPRGERGVRFLADLDEAGALAQVAERPLLVYGYYPGCPMCAALEREVFADEQVADLAQLTVPVRVNLASLPQSEQRALIARGYPFLELWNAPERQGEPLARDPDAARFLESLHEQLDGAKSARERRSWDALRDEVARYGAARTAERDGSYATAERGFAALADTRDVPEPLAERARAGLARLAAEARAALVAARDAGADEHAARNALERGIERFAGTRWEADLRRVLERLERTGRFPALAGADTSA